MDAVNCEQIVREASEFLDDGLSGDELRVFDEHVSACDSCPEYLSQLRRTLGVLRDRPGLTVPDSLRRAVEDAMVSASDSDAARDAAATHGAMLLALARTYDERSAEDLVQNTWLRAFDESPEAFTGPRLVQILTEIASSDDEVRVGSWDDHDGSADAAVLARDADADTAELFYPAFYPEGPEAGAWIQPVNAWAGEARLLSPEDDLTTTELYGVVDAAIGQLTGTQERILTLVDIEAGSSTEAAAALGLDPGVARDALRVARNHVRSTLDNYVTTN